MDHTRFRFTFTARDFLLGVAAGLTFLFLTSCTTADVGMHGGISRTTATRDSDPDSVRGRGASIGLRAEASNPSILGTQVGVRGAVTARTAGETINDVEVEAESGEVSGSVFVRGRPFGPVYLEGFAGYAHNFGEARTAEDLVTGDDGDLLYGLGLGVETRSGLRFGVEWSRRDFDIEDVNLRADDFSLVLGGIIRW